MPGAYSRVEENGDMMTIPYACYSTNIDVGFVFKLKDLEKAFGKKVPEKSHMEPRWDSKTGKRLRDKKVVDEEASICLQLDGKKYGDDWMRFAMDVAKKIDCYCGESFLENHDEHEYSIIVFGPKQPDPKIMATNVAGLLTPVPLPLKWVMSCGPEIERIRGELVRLGLRPSEPQCILGYLITY